MRVFALGLMTSFFMTGFAWAHPEPEAPTPTPEARFESLDLDNIQLPTDEEIDEMIAKLPDMTGMMSDLMTLAKDGRLQDRMERAGESVAERINESGAMETDENGLPDFNTLLAVMLKTMNDEDVVEPMLDTLQDLQVIMAENMPEKTPAE